MKDWIIIAGTLLILIIIIDGIRRKRNDRYGKIRVSPNMKKRLKNSVSEEPVVEEKPSYVSELPNGGARVVGHRDPSEIVESMVKRSSQPQFKKTEPVIARQNRAPEQTRLNLDESVPMLMESVADSQSSIHERVEPHFAEESHGDDLDAHPNNHRHEQNDEYESSDAYEELDDDYQDDIDQEINERYQEDDGEGYDSEYEDEEDIFEDESGEKENNTIANVIQEPEEVLVVHVMATKDQMLNGSALLDTVLQCGMRYGNMDIFHRYSDAKGEGTHLFSMANMVKPGTFDLDAMDQFETPGVSFFMTLPINADSMQTFDLMVDTARTLAGTLGGELKDDQRSVMTKQTLEHCRERIRDYERQRLFRRPK
jgi:cell division protein ZipA